MTPPPNHPLTDPFEPEGVIDPDGEVSSVSNDNQMYRKLEKLDRTLLRLVDPISQIPEINQKVQLIGERVAKVEVRVEQTEKRTEFLDHKVEKPHSCVQIEVIEQLRDDASRLSGGREENAKHIAVLNESLGQVKTDVRGYKDLRRSNTVFWIGVASSFLVAVFGAIWYARGVQAAIDYESQERVHQYQVVEKALERVSRSNEPVLQKIEQIQATIGQDAGIQDMDAWCDGLTDPEMTRIISTLPQKSWPDCRRIREATP